MGAHAARDLFRHDTGQVGQATAQKIWPVIVTSHAFPIRDSIDEEIRHGLAVAGHLRARKIAPLAILSAEELFFCEGFMERGDSFLALIAGWKRDPSASPHSFKNYLIELGGGQAPGSNHFEHRYAESSAEQLSRLFGKERSSAEVLARLRGDG